MKIHKKGVDCIPIPRALLADTRISMRAKGAYCILSGVSSTDVARRKTKKGEAFKAALKELIDYGWAEELDDDTINLNMRNKLPEAVKKEIEHRTATRTPEEWMKTRKEQRDDFQKKCMEKYDKMKDPKMPLSEFNNFLRYWAAIDDINPAKPMPFQKTKSGVFNIAGRLRTWQSRYNEKNNDRL